MSEFICYKWFREHQISYDAYSSSDSLREIFLIADCYQQESPNASIVVKLHKENLPHRHSLYDLNNLYITNRDPTEEIYIFRQHLRKRETLPVLTTMNFKSIIDWIFSGGYDFCLRDYVFYSNTRYKKASVGIYGNILTFFRPMQDPANWQQEGF